MHPLHGALRTIYASAGYMWWNYRSSDIHKHLLPEEPHSTAELLFLSQCLEVAAPVFDGVGLAGFQEQGQCFFSEISCSLHFCLLLFSLSVLSF